MDSSSEITSKVLLSTAHGSGKTEPSPCLHIHTLRQQVFLHRFGSHKKVPERWVNNCVKEEGDTLGSLSPLRPEDEGWDCQWVGWGYGEWAIKITASALGNQGKRICFTLKLALQINLNGCPGRTDFLITTFQPLLHSPLPALLLSWGCLVSKGTENWKMRCGEKESSAGSVPAPVLGTSSYHPRVMGLGPASALPCPSIWHRRPDGGNGPGRTWFL